MCVCISKGSNAGGGAQHAVVIKVSNTGDTHAGGGVQHVLVCVSKGNNAGGGAQHVVKVTLLVGCSR